MTDSSFTGREGKIIYTPAGGAATVIGSCQQFDITVEHDLEEVNAIGDYRAQDIKEGLQHVRVTLRKVFIDNTFYALSQRDANGYLTYFDVEGQLLDHSGGASGPYQGTKATGCKVKKWGKSIPVKGGVVFETVEAWGKDWVRTTGTA